MHWLAKTSALPSISSCEMPSVATTFAVDALDIQRVCEESEESESVDKSQEVHRSKYPTQAPAPEPTQLGSEGGSQSDTQSQQDKTQDHNESSHPGLEPEKEVKCWHEDCIAEILRDLRSGKMLQDNSEEMPTDQAPNLLNYTNFPALHRA